MDDLSSIIKEGIKADLLKEGLVPRVDTPLCKDYLAKHPNCVGCISERACKAMAERMLAILDKALLAESNDADLGDR